MKVLSAHQPNFLPWAGFFLKIVQSDLFVFSDDVQYSKQQLINRANFRTRTGDDFFLVVPVSKKKENRICDKLISRNDLRIFQKGINKIKLEYQDLEFFCDIVAFVDLIYCSVHELEKLSELNLFLIKKLCFMMDISLNYKLGTELGLDNYKSNDRLLYRSKVLGVDGYLCGRGASSYQDDSFLTKNGMSINYVNYELLARFGDDAAYSVVHLIGKYGLATLRNFYSKAKFNVS